MKSLITIIIAGTVFCLVCAIKDRFGLLHNIFIIPDIGWFIVICGFAVKKRAMSYVGVFLIILGNIINIVMFFFFAGFASTEQGIKTLALFFKKAAIMFVIYMFVVLVSLSLLKRDTWEKLIKNKTFG